MSYTANLDRRTYGTGKRAKLVKRRAMQLSAVLPHDEAVEQARWELNFSILRALDGGATQNEIARHLGVSFQRVHHYKNRARRKITPPLMLPPEL